MNVYDLYDPYVGDVATHYPELEGFPTLVNVSTEIREGVHHIEDGTVILEPGQIWTLGDNVSRLAVESLTMGRGSILLLPPTNGRIEIVINQANLADYTAMIAVGSRGVDRRGPLGTAGGAGGKSLDIELRINSCTFDFRRGSSDPPPSSINRVLAAGPRGLNRLNPRKLTRFSVLSFGGDGGEGAQGHTGAPAKAKTCLRSLNGEPAKSGEVGANGGAGGLGGDIQVVIKVAPSQPPVSNLDVRLISSGGAGGNGGPGGRGGRGAPGKQCAGYSRGSMPGAADGPKGAGGPRGDDGMTDLKLRY